MKSSDKLLASSYLIKRAYANYLEMGRQIGGRPAAPAVDNNQPARAFGGYFTGGRLQEGPSPAGAKAYDPMNVMGLFNSAPAAAEAPAPAATTAPERGPIPTISATPSMMMPTDAKLMPKAQPAAAGKADLNSVFAKFMGSSFDPKSKLDRSKMKYLQTLADQGIDLSKARASDIYDTRRGYGKW
jgi:hypothetical protein